jgi:hypothetical protein
VTAMAASDRSFAPAVTTPMVLLRVHWFLDAAISKVTATHILAVALELYASQAATHSAKVVPLALATSFPIRAVLQRMR